MKNVLITGGQGNLGTAVVNQFLNSDCEVYATMSPGKTWNTRHPSLHPLEIDLTDPEATEHLINKNINTPTIDSCVLLAGSYLSGGIEQTTSESLKKMFAVNFETAFNITKPVFKKMIHQPSGGRIILIGAQTSLIPNKGKNSMAYALSKSLLFKLSELLNAEGTSKNVITHVLAPGTINTPINRQVMPEADFTEWVKPEQIAETIYFLCSERGQAIKEGVFKM